MNLRARLQVIKSEYLLDVLLGVALNTVFVHQQCPNQCSHYYQDSHRKKNWASLPQEQITSFKYIILCSCIAAWRFSRYPSTTSRGKQTPFVQMKGYLIYSKILNIAEHSKNAPITITPKCLQMAI